MAFGGLSLISGGSAIKHFFGAVGFCLASAVSAALVLAFSTANPPNVLVRERFGAGTPAGSPEAAVQREYYDTPPRVDSSHLTFRGTLLEFTPGRMPPCGYFYFHKAARYRVDAIVAGQYDSKEIVVDHPSCDSDAFEGLRVGDRVEVTVLVRDACSDCVSYPQKGQTIGTPHTYYVADSAIRLLEN